jgi:hypothetical protein
MVDDDRPGTGHDTSHADQMPGGGSSRGPEFGTGGEPQGLVPPYDEERGEPGQNTAPKAFDASNAPARGPEPAVSDEEREGMAATDTEPEPPLGVGQSRGGRAEDLAPHRDDVDTKGPAARPVDRTPEQLRSLVTMAADHIGAGRASVAEGGGSVTSAPHP